MTTQAALRRLPRPTQVLPCAECGVAIVTNYPACPTCHVALERFWLADWRALLDEEQIAPGTPDETLVAQVVFDEGERHPWTLIDLAMTLLTCGTCGSELGGGPSDCSECTAAWGVALWAETLAGRNNLVTFNEHAMHVGRMVLRHRHRQSANIVAAWSRTMPRVLTGWLPSTAAAQQYMAHIKVGRLAEVDAYLADLDRSINETANKNTRDSSASALV